MAFDYSIRMLRNRRLHGRSEPEFPAPFVVGVGRSGTTLLRMMLDSHPELAIPPETHFLNPLIQASGRLRFNARTATREIVHDERRRWNDFGLTEDDLLVSMQAVERFNTADAMRAFYRAYAEKHGKLRWGDKTPDYIRKMRKLQKTLPEARFIHVIRDGRDAGLSQNARIIKRGKDPVPAREMARRWRKRIVKSRVDAEEVEHYLEIRYEDLVADTENALRRVCEHIELDFDPAMLTYYERAEERLQEMAGALPAKKGRPEREAGERIARPRADDEAAGSGAARCLEARDDAGGERRVRERGRLPARRPRLRDGDAEVGVDATRGVGALEVAHGSRLRQSRIDQIPRSGQARLALCEPPCCAVLYPDPLASDPRPRVHRGPRPLIMGLFSRLKKDDARREPVPFVVGMNRSGTTLLRMMLDAHPDLTIPPETHFVPDLIKAARESDATPESALEAMKSAREWGDFGFSDEEMLGRLRALPEIKPGPAVRTFYAAYTEEQGKPRWGEKTPTYVQKMKLIQRAIPEARFVHVIRDGRDVALSVLDRTVRELTAGDVARRWQKKITKAREDSPNLDHYIEIRYEDLILDTEPTLRRVCEFIELPWDDSLLDLPRALRRPAQGDGARAARRGPRQGAQRSSVGWPRTR